MKEEVPFKILNILSNPEKYPSMTVQEIQTVLTEQDHDHNWSVVKYALKNLKKYGIVVVYDTEGGPYYQLEEWYNRDAMINSFHESLKQYIEQGVPDIDAFFGKDMPKDWKPILSEEEKLIVEFLWARGLSEAQDKMKEFLRKKGVDIKSVSER